MLREKTNRILNSNGILVFIVFLALFLDNMLLTTVVPILPNFLIEESLKLKKTNATPEFNFLNVYDKAFYNKFQINNTKNESKKMAEAYKQEIQNTHESVGWVFSSKAVFQLLFNPFLGKIITRVGYSIPMFLGFIILFISTLVFAFAKNYYLLVFARSMQGIGSAFTAVSGLGKLAHVYDDDKKRGNMMSLAMSGLALGVLIGPPYGGILYQFVGKSLPFVILAILALFDGTLQVMALKLEVKPEPMENKISSLICDPYILITAGAISFANLGIASLEPTLPLLYRGPNRV
ncbi:Monoamine transporter [Intoshia linei]|uniref:Monoamine transporter n=1 Tax=Intoshia linei TaxID=1819745 RepID=A0A177AZM7_9BILA|nr:Monoamine transporter [Intoshia linei]